MKIKKNIKIIDSNFEISEIFNKNNKKKLFIFKKSLVKFINIGYYLITPLLLGIFLGFWLNKFFKTNIFIKIFLIIGFFSSFFNLYKIVKEIEKENYDRN